MFTTKKTFTSLAAAAALALTLSACGGGGDEAETPMSPSETSSSSESMSPSETETSASPSEDMTESESMDPSMDPAANLVGPGCAAYAEAVPDGAGSVSGMAQDPVATAASNNPLLTTLVSAVSGQLNPEVDLVSTLNSDEFTVFAPVDDAFAKIDPATLESLGGDATALSTVLTYHVVPGQLDPEQVVGTHTTVEGEDLTIEGSGDDLMVGGQASVICGGVQTANATVYLIDTVLMPPSMMS
ncbi:fasciclin domain-containing protein [Litorihabitans aurantiacus]|uniref:Cell surface glycolipoprotein MPT83 n=1 Tax=Litorihabitans aurantiacus TaxID=1930061 RepID=A0AA37XHZ5_9MICO|nr:fasciclin domain-containing protein [Litorihabitans aurantiacus]GMA33349.1 cell surface glycolipoprotein MPT83 [Litorihabitans aurantiacus]